MTALTSRRHYSHRRGIPGYRVTPSNHSIPKHPLTLRQPSVVAGWRSPWFRLIHGEQPNEEDFAMRQLARRIIWPNRVYFHYGLVVRFPLLSTTPHGEAVMFYYRRSTLRRERTCTSPMSRLPRRTVSPFQGFGRIGGEPRAALVSSLCPGLSCPGPLGLSGS